MDCKLRTLVLGLLLLVSLDAQELDSGWDVQDPGLPLRELRFEVDEGTWVSCDVSPDGSQIVFDLLGDIYLLPLEGGAAQCIKAGLAWDIQPCFSPDGAWIAYCSDQGGGDNVWIMRSDGSEARAVSDESFRLLNNPCWMPDGRYIVARKHFTSRRSLGAGEMWMFPLSGGPGVQLTERKNDQQDAGEPSVSPDGRFLYWSEDVSGGSTFQYNKDPNEAIYAIWRKDLETLEVVRQVGGQGGAVCPQPSPDGRWLAWVRRVRNRSVLYLQDLRTGESRPLFDGMSKDAQETWAIFGVHPGFAWTPDSRELVYSAQGGLWRQRIAGGPPRRIPFRAEVQLQIAETQRPAQTIDAARRPVRVCRGPVVGPDGQSVVFQALGQLWQRELAGGEPRALTGRESFAYTPSFSPDGQRLVFTRWHDVEGGRLCLLEGGRERSLLPAPGHYLHPRFSPDGRWLVYEKLAGDALRGRAFSFEPGIYLLELDSDTPPHRILSRGERPRFSPDGTRILVEDHQDGQAVLLSYQLDGDESRVVARSPYVTEWELSPDGEWLAFTYLWNAYVCPLPSGGGPLDVSAELKAVPLARLSRDAGQDLSFSADSRQVYWGLADSLYCASLDALFPEPFGVARLPEAPWDGVAEVYPLGFGLTVDRPEGELWLRHGRLVTMRGDELLDDGVIQIVGCRIQGIWPADAAPAIPAQATVLDLEGRTVLPGLLDVHAHIRHGSRGMLPQRNWQHLANLSFGVTTSHDPSNDTRMVFAAAELQAAGRILAPRIFSTGTILYGADGDFKAVVDSYDDALSHLRRTAAFGAFSVKSYNQPRRDQRQQILRAARELGLAVVPEGGSTLQHNLNQIVDGHTTIEHNLAVAPLYEDVLQLFAASGTAYTPTLVVSYGGPSGENWFYQHEDVWRDARLSRWMPQGLLDARARRRTMLPEEEFHHKQVAASAAELARRGTLVQVGGHGQLQGLAAHWEMRLLVQGGMTPHDALRAGTIWAAQGIGIDAAVGSIEPGKLADLIVVDGDPLAQVEDAARLRWLILNGRLYDADSLEQLYPERRPLPPGPQLEDALPLEPDWFDACPHH